MPTNDDLKRKYLGKLAGAVGEDAKNFEASDYSEFKKESLPFHHTFYEKLCNTFGNLINVEPNPKVKADIEKSLKICHIDTTAGATQSVAFVIPIIFILIFTILSIVFFGSLFMVLFFLFFGIALVPILQKYPLFLANRWRMKASNQMVLSVFYVVTYMRHNSNLELAIRFAATHLSPPLSVDLKKIVWNVETEKYSTIKESLDEYLETWREWNLEFMEAFHLIESSLLEPSEDRRVGLLDKSLDVILEETYEKMQHYAQNLNSPLTMLHMIGIIMPILGLVILPLVVSFMTNESLTPGMLSLYISLLYNVALPVSVYYLGKTILSKRPTGYGDSDITDKHSDLNKYKYYLINFFGIEIKINPIYISIIVGMFFIFLGLLPLILHATGFPDIGWGREDELSPCKKVFCLMEYRFPQGVTEGDLIGPFGIGAAILSTGFVLGIGLAIGIYYSLKSKNIIEIRAKSKQLESEFASALFQLGNRLGDGVPAEVAFGKVAEIMQNSEAGNFFRQVDNNIRTKGMSVKAAIFDKNEGVMHLFPSSMIDSSMQVLVESIKKGPLVAANALENISRYIKEIHRIDERINDLMSDTIASMKSQISFLAPTIAGIVIGITSMITFILSKLTLKAGEIANSGEAASSVGGLGGLTSMFGDGVPTFYFQIIVGLYIVQITYIITLMINGIENGEDKLAERYLLGKNMIRGTIIYSILSIVIMILFNYVAGSVIKSALG